MRHEERAAFVTLQNCRIIADVIAGKEGQHHNVGGELPNVLNEGKEFLRRAVAIHPEIHDLYSPVGAARGSWQHLSKCALDHLTGCVLLRDLLSFYERITQHSNP